MTANLDLTVSDRHKDGYVIVTFLLCYRYIVVMLLLNFCYLVATLMLRYCKLVTLLELVNLWLYFCVVSVVSCEDNVECLNGGTCMRGPEGTSPTFTCICDSGFTGQMCEGRLNT